jgi:hypothetical protein
MRLWDEGIVRFHGTKHSWGNGLLLVQAAMRGMSRVRATVMPNQDPAVIDFYQKKFKVFRKMHSDWLSYREIMTAT